MKLTDVLNGLSSHLTVTAADAENIKAAALAKTDTEAEGEVTDAEAKAIVEFARPRLNGMESKAQRALLDVLAGKVIHDYDALARGTFAVIPKTKELAVISGQFDAQGRRTGPWHFEGLKTNTWQYYVDGKAVTPAEYVRKRGDISELGRISFLDSYDPKKHRVVLDQVTDLPSVYATVHLVDRKTGECSERQVQGLDPETLTAGTGFFGSEAEAFTHLLTPGDGLFTPDANLVAKKIATLGGKRPGCVFGEVKSVTRSGSAYLVSYSYANAKGEMMQDISSFKPIYKDGHFDVDVSSNSL